jgi:hypothetical protein
MRLIKIYQTLFKFWISHYLFSHNHWKYKKVQRSITRKGVAKWKFRNMRWSSFNICVSQARLRLAQTPWTSNPGKHYYNLQPVSPPSGIWWRLIGMVTNISENRGLRRRTRCRSSSSSDFYIFFWSFHTETYRSVVLDVFAFGYCFYFLKLSFIYIFLLKF